MANLPDDLISEILLRSHVILLLRLKSVCRLWKNIISSPSFVQKHYHHSNSTDFSNFFSCFGKFRSFTYYDAHCLLCPNRSLKPLDLTSVDTRIRCLVNVVGPCHGVFLKPCCSTTMATKISCVVGPCHGIYLVSHEVQYSADKLALWNPATRRIKLLPPLPPVAPLKLLDWYGRGLGVGVDPLRPGLEFKIVLLSHECDQPYFLVYNSTTQLWKLGEDPTLNDPCFELATDGIFANGFIYWLIIKEDYAGEHLLLAMDLRNDSFRKIKVPCTRLFGMMPEAMRLLTPQLGLYKDSLALLTHVEGDILPDTTIMVDLWCMEEQGRWTKLTTTSLVFEFVPRGHVGFWSRTKIYINKDGKTVIIYDIDSGNTSELQFQKLGEYLKAYSYSDPFPYPASLASI